jgi:CheY-like chemotaxis protein
MEKPRLLITDDEPLLRDLFSLVFRDNYQVYFTANGLEAIQFLKENKVDLILLDLVMPFVNGIEVLNWIKENEKDLPVLLMSSYDIQNLPHPFGELGIKGFLSKPFEIGTLQQQVREAIKHNQSEKDETENHRISERRSMFDRRKEERRSKSYVEPSLIFSGKAIRRGGLERRNSKRRDVLDRRI